MWRFKTLKEVVDWHEEQSMSTEYENWFAGYNGWCPAMDYLLGTEVPDEFVARILLRHEAVIPKQDFPGDCWYIKLCMLIEIPDLEL